MDKAKTIKLLEVFRQVENSESFSKAGLILNLSKSQVSKMITELEENLGRKLFYRTTRSLSLTEQGQAVLHLATPLLEELENLESELFLDDPNPAGNIIITAPPLLGNYVLAPIVSEFMMLYPSIHFDLRISSAVVNIVQEGIDIALRLGEVKDSRFYASSLGDYTYGLCCSKKYAKENSLPRTLNDLHKHPLLIIRNIVGGRGRISYDDDDQIKHLKVNAVFESDSSQALLALINRGMGIGQIPKHLIEDNNLTYILPKKMTQKSKCSLIYQQRREYSRKLKLFIEFVENQWPKNL